MKSIHPSFAVRRDGGNDGFQVIALKAIALENILNLGELAAAQAIDFGLFPRDFGVVVLGIGSGARYSKQTRAPACDPFDTKENISSQGSYDRAFRRGRIGQSRPGKTNLIRRQLVLA